ncbi:MAG: hypothetical protein AAF628_16630 [Planctomycetota bacterium]
MRWGLVLPLLILPSCALGRVTHDLDHEAPPPEFGRPAWVRTSARIGAFLGGVGGAVLSVAALPVTYPVSLLADEPLGYAKEEFLFAPMTGTASLGHFLFGAPPDMLHFVFYRAWVEGPRPYDYEYVPMAPTPPPPALTPPPGDAGAPDPETPPPEAPGQPVPNEAGAATVPELGGARGTVEMGEGGETPAPAGEAVENPPPMEEPPPKQ